MFETQGLSTRGQAAVLNLHRLTVGTSDDLMVPTTTIFRVQSLSLLPKQNASNFPWTVDSL